MQARAAVSVTAALAFLRKVNMALANNNGNLFPSVRHRDRSPAYTGLLKIDGRVFQIAAWPKSTAAGGVYMALAVRPFVKSQQSEEVFVA